MMETPPRPPDITDIAVYTAAWAGVRADFLTALSSRPGDAFQQRPADGSWSAAELAEHLYLTQFLFARSIPNCLGGKLGYDMNTVGPVDYDSIFEKIHRTRGVKNPPRVTPENGWDLDGARAKLDRSRTSMEKNLADKTPEALRSRGYDHPLLGPLSLLDWFWVLTLHENAHYETMKAKFSAL